MNVEKKVLIIQEEQNCHKGLVHIISKAIPTVELFTGEADEMIREMLRMNPRAIVFCHAAIARELVVQLFAKLPEQLRPKILIIEDGTTELQRKNWFAAGVHDIIAGDAPLEWQACKILDTCSDPWEANQTGVLALNENSRRAIRIYGYNMSDNQLCAVVEDAANCLHLPAKSEGRCYAVDAACFVIREPGSIRNLKKYVIPHLSEKHGTKAKSIWHALDYMLKSYGCSLDYHAGKLLFDVQYGKASGLCPKEFLSQFVNLLRMEFNFYGCPLET